MKYDDTITTGELARLEKAVINAARDWAAVQRRVERDGLSAADCKLLAAVDAMDNV